jgi:integrase
MKQKFECIEKHLYRRQYQTAGGDWRTLYYVIFTDWKKKRRTFPVGSDLKTSREELRVLQARNIRKEDFDKDKTRGLTLFSCIDRFLQVKASKRSLKKDKVSAERIKAFFGDRPLDSILTSEIEAYKQKRLGEVDRFKRLPQKSTINRELACLRSILLLAARDGILDKVPYLELFDENNTRSKVISQDEFGSLLTVSPQHLQDVMFCLWDTGMREAEALELTWSQVDFTGGFIRLTPEDTKTETGRMVPISPRLKVLLQTIWKRERAGKLSTLTDRVFLYRGKPFNRFSRAFKTACGKAKINGLWIHDLRASFATRKINERFDRDWVKAITGHKTDHVFKRYNRPTPDHLKAVVAGDAKNVYDVSTQPLESLQQTR